MALTIVSVAGGNAMFLLAITMHTMCIWHFAKFCHSGNIKNQREKSSKTYDYVFNELKVNLL